MALVNEHRTIIETKTLREFNKPFMVLQNKHDIDFSFKALWQLKAKYKAAYHPISAYFKKSKQKIKTA